MERDAQRNYRQRLAYEKHLAKAAMLQDSAEAAAAYDNVIALLTAAHRTTFERRVWTEAALAFVPDDAMHSDAGERAAAAALASYRPGWFSETFGVAKRRRAQLSAAIDTARAADQASYAAATADVLRRREDIAFAQSVVAREPIALRAALETHAALNEVAIEGLGVMFTDGRVIAMVDALEPDEVPTHSITLLQSGKISRKPLAAGKILELHRDCVCSAAIRVVVEFLSVLPLEAVEVIVHCDLLDRASGHIAAQPVFYARVTAQALAKVNLGLAEAGPLAERLGAHFDWSKREGFRPINLGPYDLPPDLHVKEPA